MSQYGQNPQGDYGQQNYGSNPYGQSQQGGHGSYQQPSGMQQYASYGQQGEHPQAQTVLILGILGFVTGITAYIGWYMGGKAKKEIEAGAPYRWDGNLKTGYLISKILSIISIVSIAVMIVIFIVTLAGLSAMSS
ncbi:hypothetical protein [uncultured Tessaracoccus sp.]|uniref:hypothetical protein n=1 Tax=uncultured Tessaracoccus sp. TaxID=905023 RepID=UPI0026016216|nr:hypothetical protein [uncultured Tessaracoccus sp.]